MSTANTKTTKRQLTSEEEETLYFRDTTPNTVTINIDHLEVDRICTRCGYWKSEHPWETCRNPNWV
jgi:hypothetical protein